MDEGLVEWLHTELKGSMYSCGSVTSDAPTSLYGNLYYLISSSVTNTKGLSAPTTSLQWTPQVCQVVQLRSLKDRMQRELDKLQKQPMGNL